MDSRKTIAVSAVNLRKGGTLTILRQCLEYLSSRIAAGENLRVVALVHDRKLCDYPGIEYIEIPWSIKSWFHRLWCEYVTMYSISKKLAPVDVWLSLHDTTPNVVAKKREVYCHTSFPFMKPCLRDFISDPKIPLFTLFTKFAYRINVHKNDCLIVQQQWFAKAMSEMLGVPLEKFRVIPPRAASGIKSADIPPVIKKGDYITFFYASTPDCHKNFETLCEAAEMLEKELGEDKFKVILTIKGDENRYARWLFKKWSKVKSIDFHGLMKKDELFSNYAGADCFVFPSRVETWGLPISEFMAGNKGGAMLLADLPYAHETSQSTAESLGENDRKISFFPVRDASALKSLMEEVIISKQ